MIPVCPSRKKIRGTSLTEVAIVLGVLGLILGAVWVSAGFVMTQVKKERFSEQMVIAVNNIRMFYQNQPGISGTTATVMNTLISNRLLPKEMVTGATTAIHPWDGGFSVAPIAGVGNQQRFNVTLSGLRADACTVIIYYLVGSTAPAGLSNISIGGTNISIPITSTNALVASCSAGGDVVVTYKLRAPM